MRILVTGGTGFQGSHLTESLLKKGHKVTILNTLSERALLNIKKIKDKINLVWGSITDPEIVNKTVREQDAVIHLAAYINVDESRLHPEKTIKTNVMGTVNILNAVKESGNKLIYGSSCEVYGDGHPNDGKLSETAELRPNSPYAASKAAADRICHSYFKTFGTNITIVRPFNIFGERQKAGQFGALVPILVNKAMHKENLIIFGDGKQARDYLHVNDMVSGYVLTLERKDLKGKVINFASGKSIRVIDIAEYISKKFKVKVLHGSARPGEVSKFGADISYAESLGWKPKINFWKGLDRYIEWSKKHPEYF